MNKKKKTGTLILAVIILAFIIALPNILNNDYYMVVINRILINTVVVLGLNFITGLTGQMNLGTAGIYALGAYSSALFVSYTHFSPWLGLAVAVVVGLLIGRLLGYPSLRIRGVYLSLTTIGFAEVVRLLLANLTGITGGTTGLKNIPCYSIFGFEFNTQTRMYYLFVVMAAIAFFIAFRIVHSKWGRVFKSLRDNIDAVEMTGVDVADMKIKAFTIAAIFGTVGGAMYAHFMGYINPSSFTVDLSTNYVIMLMVGGLESVVGCFVGSVVVTGLPEVLRFLGDYYQIVFLSVILIGAIFFPNGWLDLAIRGVKKLLSLLGIKISQSEGGK
ncbi:MAG: branched-chain amino acid ABC transporter permease [Candidatus Choladocola sp.]|nr:branched-chain amino acid ABC transporter permease [Candidatus Choladocola sp.]